MTTFKDHLNFGVSYRTAGFSRAKPWLPVHPGSPAVNVASQQGDPASLLSCYRNLLALRRESPALQAGTLEWIDAPRLSPDVVAYRRAYGKGAVGHRADVFLNFSGRTIPLPLGEEAGRMLFSNRAGEQGPAPRDYALGPYEGIVVLERGA